MRALSMPLVIGCVLTILCFTGCAVPPRSGASRASIVVPGPREPANARSPSPWPSEKWWLAFRDPTLDALIEQAFGRQPTLRIAQARVARARGAAVAAGAPLRPSVTGSASVLRKGISSGALVPAPLAGRSVNYGSLALDLEYDFDFWGRNHALLAATRDEVAVAEAEQADAHLILATAVTATYFNLRYALEQSHLADESVNRRTRILSLVTERQRVGLDQLATVRQAQAEVDSAQVLAIQARNRAKILRDALAALTGQAPDATASVAQPLSRAPPALQLPQLVPADLIGRRPDLAALREQISAATERTRAAKAEFFPNINLASFLGLENHDLPELMEGASRTWGAGLALDLPIFDGGLRRGRLEVRRSELDIAIEAYNSLLLRAVQQSEDAALWRAFRTHEFPPPAESLGALDGLTSGPNSHSQRSMVRGGDGRLWIATESGTLSMDPERAARGALPPGVAISSLTVDHRTYRDPGSLELPAAPSNIEIDYAVLSLADPRHARVRYRLEGYDRSWIDPGMRRQAFYTNLPPGKYRFRVIGANDAGDWNRAGAEVSFDIPPTFLQSRGFFALCVALALAMLWLAYRLRMAQVARRIRTRLEERLGERERIARELHDTLLQSVQGLILRFQSVANRMPPGEPSRTLLESALKRADDVIVDGRNRVQGLRVGDGPADLLAVLRELVDSAEFSPPIPIRAVVEGKPRPLHPLVSAEIRRIAGEALFNVARHARANSVDVAITFGDWYLEIEIRDDGMGIPEAVLRRGDKEGHYGLVGMRERAKRIGGTLTIDSRAGKGTDVMLRLPAKLAYSREAGWRSRLRRGNWLRRTTADG